VLHAKKPPKDRFDFFLTIVLTGSGRLPSGRSYPLATRRKERSSAEAGLPQLAGQFCYPLYLFCCAEPKLRATPKKAVRLPCLIFASAVFPTNRERLPVLIFPMPSPKEVVPPAHSPEESGGRTGGACLGSAGCCVEAAM
jgi:hypothetical protein